MYPVNAILYFVLPLFLVQYTFFPMKLISWLIDISEQYFVTTASWVLNVYTESLFSPQIVIRSQTTWSHIAYILKLCLISKLYIFYFLWPIVFACFSHTYLKYITNSSNSLYSSRSPALQANFFTIRAPPKPKNTGMGSPSLLQMNFLTQESNRGLLHSRRILYQAELPGKPPRYLAQQFPPVISKISCYMEIPGDQVNKKAKFLLRLL